jgi:hypothetical protein
MVAPVATGAIALLQMEALSPALCEELCLLLKPLPEGGAH